jgi:hypothetical protein
MSHLANLAPARRRTVPLPDREFLVLGLGLLLALFAGLTVHAWQLAQQPDPALVDSLPGRTTPYHRPSDRPPGNGVR